MPNTYRKKITTARGLALVRIVVGLLVAYHGLEVFDSAKMAPYLKWESIRNLPFSKIMLYAGKGGELIFGLALSLGIFTRIAASGIILIMLFIAFGIGHGKIWYEDQHPFLFVLLAAVFLITGPGLWSLDTGRSRPESPYE